MSKNYPDIEIGKLTDILEAAEREEEVGEIETPIEE
jgi:hypothetical protein